MTWLRRTRFETPCRIELEHSDVNLCAHVELDQGVIVGPGDKVCIHGAPISIEYGERRVIERMATVERASAIGRLWTRFAGHLEMSELYDVSFSHGAMP